MKKENGSMIFLIVVCSLLLLLPLLWIPVQHLLIVSGKSALVITDNWQYYSKTGNAYKDLIEGGKVSIENRVNNYFPFYKNLTSTYNDINYSMNNVISSKDAIIGKNSDGEYIKYNSENKFYYATSGHSDEELKERYKNTVDFFNRIANYSDVDLYLYTTLRYEMTAMGDRDLYKYINKLSSELNDKIKFNYLDSKNIGEYLTYFYRTDHHWNANGALKGYKDIGSMMNFEVEDLKIKEYEIKYYGAFAKSVLSKKVYDTFSDIDTENKTKVTDISNCDNIDYKPRKFVEQKNDFYDYYVGYFNGQVADVSLEGDTSSDRNLLIFSDSLAWSIDYLIANHFNNTYVLNLRYGHFAGKEVNYSQIIEDFEITDVLFLYEGATLIFDEFDQRMHERLIRW